VNSIPLKPYLAAEDRGVGRETLFPKLVVKDNDCVAPGNTVLLRLERPAQSRSYLQDVEEVRADCNAQFA
jgi:hypothetical protein